MQMVKYMFGVFWLVSIVFNVTNVLGITGREIPARLTNIDFIKSLIFQFVNAVKTKFINIILFASSFMFYWRRSMDRNAYVIFNLYILRFYNDKLILIQL
jgi:hypothetical protein